MANPDSRHSDNVPGKWYIDDACVLCVVCMEEAPNNIKESDDGDHACVYKQPENEEEEAQMQRAMENCPTEAVGNDGA